MDEKKTNSTLCSAKQQQIDEQMFFCFSSILLFCFFFVLKRFSFRLYVYRTKSNTDNR